MEIGLPQGWEVKISSKILDIRDGTHDTPKYVVDGIPLVTSKNLKGKDIDFNNTNKISHEDHFEISKRSKVAEGDILFAMIGTIGNPILIKGNVNFSIKNVALFKKNESEILPPFLLYYLGSRVFDQQLIDKRILKGTTQKFIPLGSFRNLELPIPPLNEQHQIVEKIEELFSELDKGIENLKTAQQQLKVYRQAVLKWAFEGKLTNENVKDGALPDGWQLDPLGEHISKIESGKSYKCDERPPQENEVGIIKVSAVTWGEFDEKESKTCFSNDLYNAKYSINEGDFLFSRANTLELVGACVIVKSIHKKLMLSDKILRFIFEAAIDKKYALYFLRSKLGKRQITLLSTGNQESMRNIGQEKIKQINIPYCIISEQQKVVQEIESRLSVCDKMEETISTSLQQPEALRQSILKRAFEGKLVKEII